MSSKKKPINLLNYPFLKRFLSSYLYPMIFQWMALVVFAVVMVEALAGPLAPGENFATAATWVIWFPLLPILFFLLGRFWCSICPFSWISDISQKLFGANLKVPSFIKKYGLWIVDIVFIFITWSDHIWGMVESPRGTGVVLLLMFTGVVITGMFFERRTWCRYLCFLGGVSSNYSRSGMLELRANKDICKTCRTKDCYKGNGKVPGCPMFEFPMTMETSASCNLCANCIKTCLNDSIRISPRIPTSEFWSQTRAHFEESFLAIVLVGIVFVQNITMLDIYSSFLKWVEHLLGITNVNVGFTILFILAMATPIILIFTATAFSKYFTGETLANAFAKFGYAVIPLDLAGMLAHNLFHILAEGKAIYFTFVGLFGMHMEGSMAFVSDPTIQLLQYLLVIAGTFGSLYTAYRIAKHNYGTSKVLAVSMPYFIVIVLFGIATILTFTVRMGLRM